jgi:hypothetical membrane protein
MIGIWISVILFILMIMVAQILTPPEYNWKKNTVSELAAQNYKNRKIMQAGFISFGTLLSSSCIIGFVFEEVPLYKCIPILIYALSVGISGIFCTQPFVKGEQYAENESRIHSLCAQLAGFSFMIAITVCIIASEDIRLKILHTIAGVFVMGCSLLFAKLPEHRGVVQRVMYLGSFLWLSFMYTIRF